MKRTRLNPFSNKRKAQLAKDVKVLEQCCERTGGIWMPSFYSEGQLLGGQCVGGKCENCHGGPTSPDYMLHPHHKKFRSQGGETTTDNVEYWCNKCHGIEGHNRSEIYYDKEKGR